MLLLTLWHVSGATRALCHVDFKQINLRDFLYDVKLLSLL